MLLCWVALLAVTLRATAAEHEFRLKKPDAQNVALMGEFDGWKAQAMTKGSDGTWTLKVSLPEGTYAYKFLVNGSDWIIDPDNSKRKTVDGVENSAVEVSDSGTAPLIPAMTPRPGVSATPFPRIASSPAAIVETPAVASAFSPSPGEILTSEVPLSEKRRAEAAKDGYPLLAHARMAIAVPQGFDPQKSWPVLVVSNTETYSNIDSLRQFKQAAVDEGWVVLAADGVEAEKDKEGGCRWPTIAATFDYLSLTWPAVSSWPIACGGMSGGAKNSAFLAADLARERHRVIGMLMMGCNQDMATVAYRKAAPPNFLATAVFLSSGKSDTIATPGQHEYVKNSLRRTGFQKVRLETFDGAHDIYPPHITEALQWFTAQSSASSSTPPPRSSELDKFFKKKP